MRHPVLRGMHKALTLGRGQGRGNSTRGTGLAGDGSMADSSGEKWWWHTGNGRARIQICFGRSGALAELTKLRKDILRPQMRGPSTTAVAILSDPSSEPMVMQLVPYRTSSCHRRDEAETRSCARLQRTFPQVAAAAKSSPQHWSPFRSSRHNSPRSYRHISARR